MGPIFDHFMGQNLSHYKSMGSHSVCACSSELAASLPAQLCGCW